jgi:hypothetical protein
MLLFTGYHAREVASRILAFQEQREGLSGVDTTDGIQRSEADLIAAGYSHLLLGPSSLCSGTTTPNLVDGVWKAEIAFGVGGELTGQWISVDPMSGGVTSAGGRTYETFGSFRRAILLSAIVDGR